MNSELFNDLVTSSNGEIDLLLRPVIESLKKRGIDTWASCQGRTCEKDFELRKHCTHSYLSFDKSLWKMRKRIRKLGLVLYNGNQTLSALTCRETSMEEIIAKNLTFSDKLRELFDLQD